MVSRWLTPSSNCGSKGNTATSYHNRYRKKLYKLVNPPSRSPSVVGDSCFLAKINKQISQYLAKYQYLCTHETDYEENISTYFVEQRYNISAGMCSRQIHHVRYYLVPADHFHLFFLTRGVCQLPIGSPAVHPPIYAYRQEMGRISRTLYPRRTAHQQSDV